jgi:hypothetical protein
MFFENEPASVKLPLYIMPGTVAKLCKMDRSSAQLLYVRQHPKQLDGVPEISPPDTPENLHAAA